MNDSAALEWLARSALGGGLVLLIAWWGMRRVKSPARRQRLGEGGVAAALLLAVLCLAPGWIGVQLPSLEPPPAAQPSTAPPPEAAPLDGVVDDWVVAFGVEPEAFPDLPAAPSPPPAAPVQAAGWAPSWGEAGRWLVALYAAVAGGLLIRWLLAHAVLWWWLRQTAPVPRRLRWLWQEMKGLRRVRLVVSPRVRVPFSCGLWRPTVVLPAWLMKPGEDEVLRWVLAHELAHLERHDPLSAVMFGLGQSLYFYLPWFWKLRREVRLCQEYLADQAAVTAGGDRLDYADFLVGWARTPGLPAAVPAVSGQGTDLFRRITMLLQEQASFERRCPRRWLLATGGGLLSLAVLLAGVAPAPGARADDPPAPEKGVTKKDDRKPEKGKDEKPARKDKGKAKDKDKLAFPDIDELMKRVPNGLDERQLDMVRRQLESARRQLEEAMRMAGGMRPVEGFGPGFGRVFPFGSPHDGRLGVRVMAPPAYLAEQLDLPKGQGLVVEAVVVGSPADKAGVKVNDVLLEVNGKAVSSRPEALARQVAALEAGKKFNLVVLRKGKKETLKDVILPEVKAQPGFPGRGAGAGFGLPWGMLPAGNSTLTLTRVGDRFTVLQREGGQVLQVRGKLVDGKAELTQARVSERGDSKTYDSLDKVPKDLQKRVKDLLEMSEKGVVKANPEK